MNRYVLAALVFATACSDDPIRPASNCEAEMAEVRRLEGVPVFSRNEWNGNFEETWDYTPLAGFRSYRRYVFRWGKDYATCEVTRYGQ